MWIHDIRRSLCCKLQKFDFINFDFESHIPFSIDLKGIHNTLLSICNHHPCIL